MKMIIVLAASLAALTLAACGGGGGDREVIDRSSFDRLPITTTEAPVVAASEETLLPVTTASLVEDLPVSAEEPARVGCYDQRLVILQNIGAAELLTAEGLPVDWSDATPERLEMILQPGERCVARFIFTWHRGDLIPRDTPDPYDTESSRRWNWCSKLEESLAEARAAFRIWANWPGCHFETTPHLITTTTLPPS